MRETASAALASVETWLKSGRPHGTVLEEFDGPEPKLNKGETVADAIERLRRRGRELCADLHRIASAPFPSSYAEQRMRVQVEALAMQGEPDVTNLIEHDGKIEFQTMRVQSQLIGAERSLAFTEIEAATPFQAWMHKDALIKRLDAKIGSEAETMGDLLAVERDESFFAWRAQSEGLPCEHRADISPLALLGLRLVTAPRANETPGTTPGYSWPMQR
jgi:hypothetical protein